MIPPYARYGAGLANELGRTGLPAFRTGGEIAFNSVRRLPGWYFYEGKSMPLATYLTTRYNKIMGMSDIAGREAALADFSNTYARDTLYKLPLAKGRGIASWLGSQMREYDIQAAETYASLPRDKQWEYMQNWVQQKVANGYGISASAQHINDFVMTRGTIMGLKPGYGTNADQIRKFTTLWNQLPVGPEGGLGITAPELGVTPELTRTLMYGSTTRKFANAIMYSHMGSVEQRMAATSALTKSLTTNSIVKMVQMNRDSRLIGGAFAHRPGIFKGLYKYHLGEQFFDIAALRQVGGLDTGQAILAKINSGVNTLLSKEDLEAIYAAGSSNLPAYQKLAMQGLPSNKILRKLGISVPRKAYVISPAQEGESIRLQYAVPERFGGKANIGDVKGILEELPGQIASSAIDPGVDIIIKQFDKKEAGRALKFYHDAAVNWLTYHLYQPDKKIALSNATRIAQIMVRHGGKGTKVLPNGIIRTGSKFTFTPKYIDELTGFLRKQNPNAWAMLMKPKSLGLKGPTGPQYVSALMESPLEAEGKIATYGLADVGAANLIGAKGLSQEIANNIMGQPVAQEYKDIFRYLGGYTPELPGSQIMTPELIAQSKGLIPRQGQLPLNVAQNPVWDWEMETTRGTRWMLPLGTTVKIGETELTHMPIGSMEARGMGLPLSGERWVSNLQRKQLELIQAVGGPQADVQIAASNVAEAWAQLSGKGHLLADRGLKTKLLGSRGTLGTLNPEAIKEIIQKQFGGEELPYGIWAGTYGDIRGQYKELTGIRLSNQEIMRRVQEGWYGLANRPPGFPRGSAPVRLAVLTPGIKKKLVRYGGEAKYQLIDAASMAYLHGDKDADPLSIISHWMNNPAIQSELQATRQTQIPEYISALLKESEYTKGTEGGLSYAYKLANIASRESADKLSTALQASQGQTFTGIAYNFAQKVMEGSRALTQGAENAPAYSRFTEEYGNQLTNLAAQFHETGINLKRQETELANVHPKDIFYGPKAQERLSQYIPTDIFDRVFGKGISQTQKNTIIEDMMLAASKAGTAARPDSMMLGAALQSIGSGQSKSIAQIAAAYSTPSPFIATNSIGEAFAKAGATGSAIKSGISGAAAQNQSYKLAALGGRAKKIGIEGVTNFVEGLKQGKGWSSLIIGAGVLAGAGLSLRRPGQIVVVPPRREQYQAPDGGYRTVNETKTPVIIPRKSIKARVLSEQEYNVRIRLKDIQRQDRNKFVELSNLVHSKYKSSGKSNINISDQSNEPNYQQIFQKEYKKQMMLGSWS